MSKHKPIPQELLDRLEYDEASPSCLRWRGGRVAGSVRADGRCNVGQNFLAYRVVWALHHGDPGELVVDHIDNDPANNRIENLQAITHRQNRTRQVGRGVYQKGSRWTARVCDGYDKRTLGWFASEEEARAAYVEAKALIAEGLSPQFHEDSSDS